MPSLDLFQGRIESLKDEEEEIKGIASTITEGWLKVRALARALALALARALARTRTLTLSRAPTLRSTPSRSRGLCSHGRPSGPTRTPRT